MNKLKVLTFNQAIMSKLALYSTESIDPVSEFFKSPITYYFLFNAFILDIISCGIFVYQNFTHFELALETFFVVIAGLQSGGMFLSFGLKLDKVKSLQLELQKIVNNGNL